MNQEGYNIVVIEPSSSITEFYSANMSVDKPYVVSQSQSQKLTTRFSLESHFPTILTSSPIKFQRSKIELYLQFKSVGFM